MNYEIKEMADQKYMTLLSSANQLGTESDALDVVALCWEHEVHLLMIHYEALAAEFFQLSTKAAGDILQKFINYNIKTAAVIPKDISQKGRFREMALETNQGNHFRIFDTLAEAEKWLLHA